MYENRLAECIGVFFYRFTENNSFSSHIAKSLSIQITFILNARTRYRNGKSKVRFPEDYMCIWVKLNTNRKGR